MKRVINRYIIEYNKSGVQDIRRSDYKPQMLQDRLAQVMRSGHILRVLTAGSYEARETLIGKALTPAMFLYEMYHRLLPSDVTFLYKEKYVKPLPSMVPIDIEEYSCSKEDLFNQYLRSVIDYQDVRMPRLTTLTALKNSVETHLNNINFHWFETAVKAFYHYNALDDAVNAYSTLEQPFALVYLLEITNKSLKDTIQKVKKDTEVRLKKMFLFNASKKEELSTMVILFYNKNKFSQLNSYCQIIKKELKVDSRLICPLQINSEDCEQAYLWNAYPRPILNLNHNYKATNNISLLSAQGIKALQETVQLHRHKIRSSFQNRMDLLLRNYEENNTTKMRFMNFFKSSAPTDEKYSEEEAALREIADCMMLLAEYKRAYELYKLLLQKIGSRNVFASHDISQQIQMCLALSKGCGTRLSSDHYTSIEKHMERMFAQAKNLKGNRLIRYLVFTLYVFHTFKVFDKMLIRNVYYLHLKIAMTQDKTAIMPGLIHQQYGNLMLLLPTVDCRKYAYQMIRTGTKFSELRLQSHFLRCFLIVDYLYNGTLPEIQKFVGLQVGRLLLDFKQYKQSLNKLYALWVSQLDCPSDSDITKLMQTHGRIITEVLKRPSQLLLTPFALPLPLVKSVMIELTDEVTLYQERYGAKWTEVGDVFLDSAELVSKRLIKNNFLRTLKHYDSVTAQEKQLTYRINALPQSIDQNNRTYIAEAVLKRNCRVGYINQPIQISFQFYNPLQETIQVQNVFLQFKQPPQCYNISASIVKEGIKAFQRKRIQFTVIPLRQGLLELKKVRWSICHMPVFYPIHQPQQMHLQSVYYKLNIVPPTAKMNFSIAYCHQVSEGELTQVQLTFRNEGIDQIDNIYLAVEETHIFPFCMHYLDFKLLPQEEKRVRHTLHIPSVPETVKSGRWRHVTKIICLYRSKLEQFRSTRTIVLFNIAKVISVKNALWERLSHSLYLLTLTLQQLQQSIKTIRFTNMFQLKKVQHVALPQGVKYFFFLKRNAFKPYEEYRVASYRQYRSKLIQQQLNRSHQNTFNKKQNYEIGQSKSNIIANVSDVQTKANKQQSDKVQLAFDWQYENAVGVLSLPAFQVTQTESGARMKLPFTFIIEMQNEYQFDFSSALFLSINIKIQIKNAFLSTEMNLKVQLVEMPSDVQWEGLVEKKQALLPNAHFIMNATLIVYRPGVYDLADCIRYKIGQNIFVHSEFQNIYLVVKDSSYKQKQQICFQQKNQEIDLI